MLNIFCWQYVFGLVRNTSLKIVFFDVGQGDSAFIETPQGHQIIIDGGPTAAVLGKLGKQMPFWDKSLDLVILTHPDDDHVTGILSLLEIYNIDYFLWTGVLKDDAENKKLVKLLEKVALKPTKIIFADPKTDILAGSAFFDVIYPFENLSGQKPKNTNESSIVFKLFFGKSKVLFTGDIGFSTERKLLKAGVSLDSDVLKTAHHGSKYSSLEDFLTVVSPETAVISCGKNSYGHPTPEVLQRLSNVGAEVLRTDQKGDITMLLDGNNITVIPN